MHLMYPTFVLATVESQDARVIEVDHRSILVEVPADLPSRADMVLDVFHIEKHQYETFRFPDCRRIEHDRAPYSTLSRYQFGRPLNASPETYRRAIDRLSRFAEALAGRTSPRRLQSLGLLEDSSASYPFDRDSDDFSSVEEQYEHWFRRPHGQVQNKAFSELLAGVELAFCLNTPDLADHFARAGLEDVVHERLAPFHLEEHALFASGFQRVYIGNEFCPALFPDRGTRARIFQRLGDNPQPVTFCLSYLTEDRVGLVDALLEELAAWCEATRTRCEVVLNDWGTLHMLASFRDHLVPVLGRLLNKRKKDPRVAWWRGYRQHAEMLAENSLNCAGFRNFLRDYGVRRFEFEECGRLCSVPPGNHSLHVPFFQVTTSTACRVCARPWEQREGDSALASISASQCPDTYRLYPKHLNMIGKGNTVYGFCDGPLRDPTVLKNHMARGIDRLVFSTP